MVLAVAVMSGQRAHAQPGSVLSHQKISDTVGGFTGILDDIDRFGRGLAALGDLDGDGVGDLAVGVARDDDGGSDRGAVWILFLNTDGTVKSHQKISDTEGGFTGILDDSDRFGNSVASLGDLDGDGVGDLAVGARHDDDGGTPPNAERGAVWILFLNTDGTVKSHQKISATEGGFTGILDDFDDFGNSVASLGDLDGDAVGDLAVGAHTDGDGGPSRGAVWILFLKTNGTVKSLQKISDTAGDFTGILDDGDVFGESVAALGDFDGDGVGDLAVGADQDNDGGSNRGAVWILLLNTDGTVKSHQKISDTEGGFTGILDDGDEFGEAVAALGDFDGDGVGDMAVGAGLDDDGGPNHGALWILFLNTDSTVKSHQKISDTEGGFTGILDDGDRFGNTVTALGDFDGDGVGDMAVGAVDDDDGGNSHGAVWVLFLGVPGDWCAVAAADAGTPSGVVTSGSFIDTQFQDNVYEALTEEQSHGAPQRRWSLLEHIWTFDVLPGLSYTFLVDAHHTANPEGDDFAFTYSLDDMSYSAPMVIVSKTADDDVLQSFAFAEDIAGTVYIRVEDTDRTQGNSVLDTVFVDELCILTSLDPDPAPPAAPSNLTATPGDTVVNLDWVDNSEPDLDGYNVYRSLASGGPYSPLTASPIGSSDYVDTGLTNGTTYYYVVTSVDLAENESADSVEAMATPQSGAGGGTMHVDSIVVSTVNTGGGRKIGRATVAVVNATGAGVAQAEVIGMFFGDLNEVVTASTNASGIAILDTTASARGGVKITFCVIDVSHPTLTYQSEDNVEECDTN